MIINTTDLGTLKITQPNTDLPPIRISLNVAVGGSLPAGGTEGQILRKLSSAPYDTEWSDDQDAQWGKISGSITEQTDLVNALASKQPISGMGAYLTQSQASGIYYTLNNPAGYITANVLDDFLTTTEASEIYQRQADMPPYVTEAEAVVKLGPYFLPLTGGTMAQGASINFNNATEGDRTDTLITKSGINIQHIATDDDSVITIIQSGLIIVGENDTNYSFKTTCSDAGEFKKTNIQGDLQMGQDSLQIFTPDSSGSDSEIGAWGFGVEKQSSGEVAYLSSDILSVKTNGSGIEIKSSGITFSDGSEQTTAGLPIPANDLDNYSQAYNNNGTWSNCPLFVNLVLDGGIGGYGGSGITLNGNLDTSTPCEIRFDPAGVVIRRQNIEFPDGSTQASAFIPSNYLTASSIASGYYPLGSNPAGYLTSSALTPYLTATQVASGYYPLGSNPAGYLTSSALTPYATLASPTFTGDPKAPTPPTADNDTSIATTAFVKAQGYLTTAPVTSVAGRTGAVTLSTTDISGIGNYALLSGATFTGQIVLPSTGIRFSDGTIQTTAVVNPSSYALLSGASFTGKVSIATDVNTVSLNIGAGKTAGLAGVAGDMWIEANNLHFRDAGGADKTVVNTNSTNTFANANTFAMSTGSSYGITLTQSGNGGGMRITNLGTGESFRVEDETTPDATAFVISNSGRVGIGVAPDSTVALTVDSTGIKVNGATLVPASAVSNPPIVSGNMSHSEYLKELLITINGVSYAIPLRVV